MIKLFMTSKFQSVQAGLKGWEANVIRHRNNLHQQKAKLILKATPELPGHQPSGQRACFSSLKRIIPKFPNIFPTLFWFLWSYPSSHVQAGCLGLCSIKTTRQKILPCPSTSKDSAAKQSKHPNLTSRVKYWNDGRAKLPQKCDTLVNYHRLWIRKHEQPWMVSEFTQASTQSP